MQAEVDKGIQASKSNIRAGLTEFGFDMRGSNDFNIQYNLHRRVVSNLERPIKEPTDFQWIVLY